MRPTRWDIRSAEYEVVHKFLELGWEPFAVTQSHYAVQPLVFLKKQIEMPDPED